MKVGSLFAGVGGFDLAFQRAGFTTAWCVENDKQCQSVLRHRFPNAEVFGDIREVGGIRSVQSESTGGSDAHAGSDLREQLPDNSGGNDAKRRPTLAPVSIICGGFPCQDYSVAGKRGGLVGDRGALWWEMHRIIADIRPTWVVGENVPGLLSNNGGRDFLTIIASLIQLGYGITWASVDSEYRGVAQRRKRLFIVGHSGGIPRPEILALSEGLFGHPAPSRETGEGTTRSTAPSLSASGRGTARAGESRGQDPLVVAHPILAREGKGPNSDADSGNIVLDNHGAYPLAFHATQDPITGEQCPALGSNMTAGVHAPTYAMAIRGRGDGRNLEARDDGTMNALLTPNGGRDGMGPGAICQSVPRRLTPTECERLQGFPDGWTQVEHNGKPMADGPRYRMMGNAVTVNVVEWIAGRIMEAEAP